MSQTDTQCPNIEAFSFITSMGIFLKSQMPRDIALLKTMVYIFSHRS